MLNCNNCGGCARTYTHAHSLRLIKICSSSWRPWYDKDTAQGYKSTFPSPRPIAVKWNGNNDTYSEQQAGIQSNRQKANITSVLLPQPRFMGSQSHLDEAVRWPDSGLLSPLLPRDFRATFSIEYRLDCRWLIPQKIYTRHLATEQLMIPQTYLCEMKGWMKGLVVFFFLFPLVFF